MMKQKTKAAFLVSLGLALGLSHVTGAEESALEKAVTTRNRAQDGAKRAYRRVDDKVCETLNDKVDCVPKRVKNRIKDASDKAKTDATDILNKVD